ncbi:hypothetical protein KC19_9G156600 [Ceratodon purpureus]|uniref:Uncharacterized protein n=1 Tax=Ceratodon purpureus TaxID=3225 RepID=A0A8T0H094_CERPU|nr:hypothetical protein KC19_9G156600 [Ceratodon purpureus]
MKIQAPSTRCHAMYLNLILEMHLCIVVPCSVIAYQVPLNFNGHVPQQLYVETGNCVCIC